MLFDEFAVHTGDIDLTQIHRRFWALRSPLHDGQQGVPSIRQRESLQRFARDPR